MALNLVIGGAAGQGLKTVNNILSKSLFRLGFNIYSTKNYMSRVRGGHNFMKIRIGTESVTGPSEVEDILLALNEETINLHKDKVSEEGIIICDKSLEVDNDKIISLPAKEIARDIGNSKAVNIVFIGAVLKLLGVDLDIAKDTLQDYFADKEKTVESNLSALEKGYQHLKSKFEFTDLSENKEQILLDGNQAVGLGALTAGVQFYSAYPMTPSTGVMNYIAKHQDELGIAVEQAEDEIAAIMMALGASYGGIRAMTGTSGGGFALMNESLSFAGIAEIPLVITEVQRPGPATGLPTRTGQGDLSFVINSGHGDFPLMVIAPRDVEDAFYQSFRAFNLAEKYQMPVIILSDQFLADSAKNIDEFDFEELEIKRSLMSGKEIEKTDNYKRYQLTEDGISPRAYPGQMSDQIVMADSNEHDEFGYITEDIETRINMVDKRKNKLDKLAKEDLIEPKYIGKEEVDYLLVGWGSTYGPLLETKLLLEQDGYSVGLLSFSDVWPLPTKKLKKLTGQDIELVIIENNSTAQFAKLIRSETGINIDQQILKYDGRPFTGQEIYHRVKKEVMG